ncbi:MAG: hypothetical protein JWL69_609, partial [Phycisphaerales bacterium]|nr:hypothetical protein [Phycisphaerales bacterium]
MNPPQTSAEEAAIDPALLEAQSPVRERTMDEDDGIAS